MAGVSEELKALLKKQHYGFAGKHSAVKICTWAKKSIRDQGVCYKQQFYGIRSHLCCQMSPVVGYCQNRCVFCWREMEHTVGEEMDPNDTVMDQPDEIIDNCIHQQKKLMEGYWGFDGANKEKLKLAEEPMHFAISLTGEPTIYPKLNELIKRLHERGKSTFVVTNGMLPERVKEIEPPTQLYVSCDVPNEKLFKKITASVLPDGWERLMKTLDALREIKDKTRTTLRFTMIKGKNMEDVEGWASLIERSEPMFIEVKAYMYVGSSRERLEMENMPRHHEVKEFAEKICEKSGYKIIDEKEDSRVLLLAKEDFDGRIMKFD